MQKTLLFFIILVLCVVLQRANGQVYLDKKSQHRFAQTYVGLSTQITPSSGSLIWEGVSQKFPTSIIPRVTLGGLHFWGKLDFNMNLYITNLADPQLHNNGEVHLNSAGDLSARYYPWRMEFGKLRPYAGLSLSGYILSLGNEEKGKRYDAFIASSPLVGVSFAFKKWQVNAEAVFLPQHKKTFYSSETQSHTFTLPSTYFSLGFVRYFDVTLKEENPKEEGHTQKITDHLAAEGKLSSFSIGFAPSAAFFIHSPVFTAELESLAPHTSSFNFDMGVGYLFDKAKFHVGLSYRNYSSSTVSYSLEHIVRRQSLAAEGYKFLFDYNGFVPFIGASISAERWATGLFRNDIQEGETVRTQMISPGIIFGWDISPSPIDTWALRTNLRYYPFQEITDIGESRVRVDQFEFNFIQLVIYPSRMINVRNVKTNYYSS